MGNGHHILNAASNLLGISLLIITGLHLSNSANKTLADEVAWIAAACFSVSCLLSYLAIRSRQDRSRSENMADKIFLGGLVTSVTILAASNLH